jgi:hypothetical protein
MALVYGCRRQRLKIFTMLLDKVQIHCIDKYRFCTCFGKCALLLVCAFKFFFSAVLRGIKIFFNGHAQIR